MSNCEPIEQVSFGHIAAEEEASELINYFVETQGYTDLQEDSRKILVVGRKGSGKSAIYLALQERFKGQAHGLNLNNYPWSIHKELRDESGSDDYTYANTWLYMILVELAKHILRYSEPKKYRLLDKKWWRLRFDANLRRLKRFLKQNYGTLAPSFGELLVNRARNIRSLDIKGFSAASQDASEICTQLITSINIVIKDLQEMVLHELPGDQPIYVLFDQLDRGWDNTREFKEMLIGLILAARDLTRSARHLEKELHVVIFLRSDIYACLRFEDKNKIFPDVITLRWNADNLRSMINRRIEASSGREWEDVVTRDRVRRQMRPFDYIIKRTMLRPRDLICFCNRAKQEALEANHSIIESEDIYQGELSYSEHMRREFQDETRGDYQDEEYIDKLFDILRTIHVERFSTDTFVEAYLEHHTEGMPEEPMAVLEYLIDLSILGVYDIGGRYGGSRYLYRYKLAPEVEIDPEDKDLVVHPSLKHALDLIEPRSS
jgi:hypothetical protein